MILAGFSHLPSHPSFLFSFWMYSLVLFCIPSSRMTTLSLRPSTPQLPRMRSPFQTIAHLPSSPLFSGTVSISLPTTCYKVPLLSPYQSSFSSLITPTNSAHSFLIIFPFRLTLRCHLYPQSTLVSPEPFFPLSVNVLFSFAYRPPSLSILAHSLSQ